jgi:uncharacterized membrane protein
MPFLLADIFFFFANLPVWAQIAVGVLVLLIIGALFKRFIKLAISLAVLTILVIVILKLLNYMQQ